MKKILLLSLLLLGTAGLGEGAGKAMASTPPMATEKTLYAKASETTRNNPGTEASKTTRNNPRTGASPSKSADEKKQPMRLVPSASDSTLMDTIVFSELEDEEPSSSAASFSTPIPDRMHERFNNDYLFVILCLMIVMGLPLFIVLIVMWFRYKNRQAKYKLASEALAAGHPIPNELLNTPEKQHEAILTKGIKNLFLGIGLFVFLWLLTEAISIAAIGFLIASTGVGQILIAYTTRPKSPSPYERMAKDDSHRPFPSDAPGYRRPTSPAEPTTYAPEYQRPTSPADQPGSPFGYTSGNRMAEPSNEERRPFYEDAEPSNKERKPSNEEGKPSNEEGGSTADPSPLNRPHA